MTTLRLLVSGASAVPVVVVSTVPALQVTHWQWIALTLAAPVVVWGAWPFHRAAAAALRHGDATGDTLVSVSTLAALGWSSYALLLGGAGAPGWTDPHPDHGAVLHLDVAVGITVVALLTRAARAPAPAPGRGRKAAFAPDGGGKVAFLPPGVLVLATGTLGFWLGTGAAFAAAFAAAAAVLAVASTGVPAMARPAAQLAGIRRGKQLGVHAGSAAALESLRDIDTVVLAGTATLTGGRMDLLAVHPAAGVEPDEALRLAGAVEQASVYPIGVAITAAARALHGALPGVSEFDALPGLGVRGLVSELDGDTVHAHAVLVGGPALLAAHGVDLPDELAAAIVDDGTTAIVVAWDGTARAVLAVGDAIRPDAASTVARLRDLAIRPVLHAGDHAAAARVARSTGIAADDVVDGPGPEPGPGVATVGYVRGSGLRIAAGGAEIRLGDRDPVAVVDAIRLARRTRSVATGNLCWALAVESAALAAAAGGLLTPMAALLVGTASAAVVVINSRRLHRVTRASPISSLPFPDRGYWRVRSDSVVGRREGVR